MPDDDAEDIFNLELGVTPLASKNAGYKRPARPTVMESFAMAIDELPGLEEPVYSYIWRKTFMQHACRADVAMADFHCELDARFQPVDTLHDSCTDLKDSCLNLRTTVTATSSDLASLVALMGHTHARVSILEAATAKNEADVATTMNALAATTAAHATTAAAVAGIGTTVTDAMDDLVGRHIGSLKSDVLSLGQDVLLSAPSWPLCMGSPLHPLHGPRHKPPAVVADLYSSIPPAPDVTPGV